MAPFSWGGAAKLIFRGGQAALAGRVAAWRRLGPHKDRAADICLAQHIAHQLAASLLLFDVLTRSQRLPGAEDMLAEFAQQVAAPDAVLPWLAPAAEAFLLLSQEACYPGW
jgi:hypothetical protein